jgi:hypothetical protein
MSLNDSRSLVGRQIGFRSFVERNEEFFKFKFNKKFSSKDVKLYEYLINQN